MYKNLFFDFDGTLFNSYPRLVESIRKTFKDKRGIDFDYDTIFKDLMESFGYLKNKYQVTEEEWNYYNEVVHNDNIGLPEIVPFDGVKELLEELTSKGVNCFIYTNRSESTYGFLEKYGLTKYFKDSIIKANKPDPTLLNDMIEKYNLDKKECMVVGDRELDLISAENAGVDSFSINDYRSEMKATYQGQGFSELLKVVFFSKIRGVIFDMDGVLISTDKLHYIAWKHVADDEGIPFDESMNDELRGISRKSSLKVLLRNSTRVYSDEEKSEMLDRKGKYYKEILDALDKSFVPQVTLDCLKELRENGIRIAMGSSSLNGLYISNLLGFADEFEKIVDGTMIEKPKPNPEVFLKAAEALGLSPNECLIVEDATAGVEAGNKGGFISVGMSYVTSYNKTNIKIDGLQDLMSVINKINETR